MGETVCDHDDDDDSNTMENLHDHVQMAQDRHRKVVEKVPDHADSDSEVAEIETVDDREDSAVDMLNNHCESDFSLKVENHDDSKIVEKERQDDDMVNDDSELTNEMIKQ